MCVLLAVVINLVTPPTYLATTRIEVSKEPTRSALTGEVIASDDWRDDNVAMFTTAELITARSLMREVVMTLHARGIIKEGPGRTAAMGSRVDEAVRTPAAARLGRGRRLRRHRRHRQGDRLAAGASCPSSRSPRRAW